MPWASDDRICESGRSPLCTDEDGYEWEGEHMCAHCYSLEENAAERMAEEVYERWHGSSHPQCEAERMAVELERRR